MFNNNPTTGPSSLRARKRQQTLDRAAGAAFALFQAKGFDAVTMEEIANAAEVARGTLYNHFPVKEAVLAHWVHRQLEQDLGRLAPAVAAASTCADKLAVLLQASAAWCEAHRAYLPPYLRYRMAMDVQASTRGGERAADLIAVFQALIAAGQASDELRGDWPAERLAVFLHHLYLAALLRWLADASLELAGEFAASLAFFFQGAAPRGAGVV